MHALNVVLICSLTCLVGSANADETVKKEWRFLGPDFSHHFSQEGAPKTGTESVTMNDGANSVSVSGCDPSGTYCNTFNGSAKDYCALSINSSTPSARAACTAQYYKPYAMSREKHHYNEQNWGLGVEFNERRADSVTRYFSQALLDSYDKPGVFFGVSRQHTIYSSNQFKIDAGFMAMAWWRTIPTFDGEGGSRRRWVITPLPLLSFEHKSGVALNVSYAPAIRVHGRQMNVNTLMFGLSCRL